MSLVSVEEFTQKLPRALRIQVIEYARSVREAAPEIFQEAGVPLESWLVDKLVWIAAMKRLHSILSSAFWTIDTANVLLRKQQGGFPVVGGTDYSRTSSFYRNLKSALHDLDTILRDLELSDLITLQWADVVRRLADERPGPSRE